MNKVKVVVTKDGTRYDGVEYKAGTSLEVEEDLVPIWEKAGLCNVAPAAELLKPALKLKSKKGEKKTEADEEGVEDEGSV